MTVNSSEVVLLVGAATHVGQVRTGNEDRFLVSIVGSDFGRAKGPRYPCGRGAGVVMAVCDGMGGAAAGEVASQITAETLATRSADRFSGHLESTEMLLDWLESAVVEANERVRVRGVLDPELHGMGSTVTATAVLGSTLASVHVGDSRLYLLRGRRLRQLSKDQTLVSLLVETGDLTREEAREHEDRHVLLQAIGARDEIEVQRFSLILQGGDRLLLCTDGLYDLVSEEVITDVLGNGSEPAVQAQALVDAANEEGGVDNVTVLIAHVEM